MKNKKQKGEYGYLSYKKRTQIILTALIFAMAFAILISSYIISGMTRLNIGTVFAVVMVLPACKCLVNVILIFPHKGIEESDYKEISSMETKAIIIYDMVLTSEQEPMEVKAVAIGDSKVVMYATWKKQKNSYVEDYFQKVMNSYCLDANVTVTDNLKKFENIAGSIDEVSEHSKEIKDTILIFNV